MPLDETLLEPADPGEEVLRAAPQPSLPVQLTPYGPTVDIPYPSWLDTARRTLIGPSPDEAALLEQRALPRVSPAERLGVLGLLNKPTITLPEWPRLEGDVPISAYPSVAAAAIWNALVKPAVEGFSSPGGVASAGALGVARGLAQAGRLGAARAVAAPGAAVFGAPMAVGAPEAVRQFGAATAEGDLQQQLETGAGAALTLTAPVGLAGAALRPGTPLPPRIELPPALAAQLPPPLPRPPVVRGPSVARPPRPLPEVPATPAEPREPILATIRNADARTIAQIQQLFPKAQLTREQARVLRNQAFPPGPTAPPAEPPQVVPRGTPPPEPPAAPAPAPTVARATELDRLTTLEDAGMLTSAQSARLTELRTPARAPEPPPAAPAAPAPSPEPPPAVPARPTPVSAAPEAPAAPELFIPALNLAESDLAPGKLKTLPMRDPAQLARLENYFGVKGVPALTRKVQERFTAMRAEAEPKPVAEPPPARKPRPTRSATERPWNIIDEIENSVGKIRTKGAMRPGEEGYYGDTYLRILRSSARRILSKTGQSWDSAADALRRSGILPEHASVDDLQDLIQRESIAEKNWVAGQAKEQRALAGEIAEQEAFETAALAPREGAKPVSVAELTQGDTLNLDGTPFTVKELVWDPESLELAYVVLEDGRRFGVKTVNGDAVIYPDEGTFTPKEVSTEFLPPEEQAEAPAAADPFALEGVGRDQVRLEEAEQAKRAAEAKAKENLAARAAAPLVGDSTDVGQAKLFQEDVDLFSGPSAEKMPPGPGATLPKATAKGDYEVYQKRDPLAPNGFRFIVAGPDEVGIKLTAKRQGWLKVEKGLAREEAYALQEQLNNRGSVGPGAASPLEFEQRAARGSGINAKTEADLSPPPIPPTPPPLPGAEGALPDGTSISRAVRERDVMPGRDYIASPEHEFRKHPIAGPLATQLIEAELGYRARVARSVEALKDRLWNSLNRAERIKVTKALRANQEGNPALLDALNKGERVVADNTRIYFEQVRERIYTEKQNELIASLPEARRKTLEQVLAGASIDRAAKANKLRDAGRQAVLRALEELQELRNWGPENYVTNIERGSYRVTTPDILRPDGSPMTVAVAETASAAEAKAAQFLRENPGVKNLVIDNSFNPSGDMPSKMSSGAYFRMIGRMAKELGTSAANIQKGLRAEGNSVVVVKPTNKFAAPLQQRRGILKGEEDLSDALPAYVYSVEKKLALDPVLKKVRNNLGNLPQNMRVQLEELANDAKGRYAMADQIADYILAPLGQKPMAISRAAQLAGTVTTNLKLGYRPVSAIVNRVSGLHHTWTKSGTADWVAGRRFMRTPEFKEVWERNKDFTGWESTLASMEGTAHPAEKLWQPLGMFQLAERVNRPEAFATFYVQGQRRLRLAPAEAEAYARKMVRLTQFVYNTASLPRIMRGPIGRTVFKFKPYLVKEMEFLSTLRGAEIPRYMAGFLALGGPRAFIYFLKSLPIFGAIGAFSVADDWLNRNAPTLSRGIPGMLGVDITAAVTPQLPKRMEDWFGPVFADLWALQRDVVTPALKGEDRDWTDLKKWGARLAPAMYYWSQLVDAVTKENGWVTDDRGRPTYKPNMREKVALAAGAKPIGQSVQEVEMRFVRDQEAILRLNRQRTIDDYLDALAKNDSSKLDELAPKLAEYGITADNIRSAARQRGRGPYERLRRSLLKFSREREAERFEGEE